MSKQLRYIIFLFIVVIAAAQTAIADPVAVELAERTSPADPGDPTQSDNDEPQQRPRRHFLRSRDVPIASLVRPQVRWPDTTTGTYDRSLFAICDGKASIFCFENPHVNRST